MLSCFFAFRGKDLSLSYLLEFVAKTESECIPLSCIFNVVFGRRCWRFTSRSLALSDADSSRLSAVYGGFASSSVCVVFVSELSFSVPV